MLFGCSKDGGNGVSIVGTWKLNIKTSQFYINDVLMGSDTVTDGTLDFESNGSFLSVYNADSTAGTYKYNASAKQLTVITGSDTGYAAVTNLTANNLHLSEVDSEEVSGDTYKSITEEDYRR